MEEMFMRIPKRSVVVILATLLVTIAASAAFATQPNDPLISQQSNMYVIHAGGSGGSWDRGGVGDGSAFVAVLSTGIDYNHEDLFQPDVPQLARMPGGNCRLQRHHALLLRHPRRQLDQLGHGAGGCGGGTRL
jgi:hypothetical protein